MRWFPPLIHCHFNSTQNDAYSARKLPSADENYLGLLGVGFVLLIGFCLSILVMVGLLVVWADAKHWRASTTRSTSA